ncbi:unnamed protein product [Vitrella brassicaformis CCMP3155]|uniref:Isochorismatase-like domain-containing protein n=1 Tax=Vitrella brassicaformis (strain CCMP3155) TaxID=1169540 RepID=A0A0G4EYR5_VITBC|nr:unnamed protein product [Vitrella brassicaformis CCMP3155]|eukprot:CEM03595.1 unnamed protein product [Vitrella brassicaformis CCMP3155]
MLQPRQDNQPTNTAAMSAAACVFALLLACPASLVSVSAQDLSAVQQNYKGAFDGKLQFGSSPCLLVVDLVNAYLREGSPLYAAEGGKQALAGTERLLTSARQLGIPVVFTAVKYAKKANGKDAGVWWRKVPALSAFVEGQELAEFPPSLTPLPSEVVLTKQYASSYFGTSLASMLTAMKVDTVVIAGVSTSGCIRATALDTLQSGFVPVVVRDAVGDRRPEVHEANLFDIQAKYGEVRMADQVLAYFEQVAGTKKAPPTRAEEL